MADEQELWQERLAMRRAGTPWSAIAKGEGISRGTFNEHLRRARQVGWIPPEEELPPAIRSDGRRVGLPGSGTHKVPDEEPSRYLEGTHQALQNVAEPMGTDKVPKESSEPTGTHGVPMSTSAPESTLPEPAGTLQDVDRRSESRQWSGSSHDLLMMVSKQADDHNGKLRALTDHIYMLEVQTSERFRVLESAMQEYARHLQPVPVD